MIPFVSRRSPIYTGTGGVATYNFAFKVFTKQDIAVQVTDTSGVLHALTVDVDYTVSLNADQDNFPGGSITLTAGNLALGYLLVVFGAQDYSQTTQLPTGGAYNATVVERAMDRIMIAVQQLKEIADRSLRFPSADVNSAQLPTAAQRAGTLQAYDEGGAPVAGPKIDSVGTVTGNIANINAVGGNIANVNAVAGDLSNINAVVPHVTNLDAVTPHVANIDTVAGAVGNVNTVAGSIGNVNTVAANITAVQQALAAGKIYQNTADGLANTSGSGTTNRYFFVPSGSASESLQLYINNAGVAALVKTYASKTGSENLLISLSNNERASTDLLPSVAWNANTLLADNGTTAAIVGNNTSNFIAVTPGAVLGLVCGPTNGGAGFTATCVAYDEAQAFLSVLYTGAVPVSPTTGNRSDNPQYITIPANARYIRLGQTATANLTLLKLTSLADKYYADTLALQLRSASASNLLGAKYYPSTGGAPQLASGTSSKGTGFIPVSVGDKITYNLQWGASTVFGVAVYDSSKTFLRWIEQQPNLGEEKSYTFNAVDDASVAYVMAGDFENPATNNPYFYVSSQNSLDRKLAEQAASTAGRGLLRKTPTIGTSTGTAITDNGTYKTVVTSAVNALLQFFWPPKRTGYKSGLIAIQIKLTALASGSSADFDWLVNPSTLFKSQLTTLTVGQTAVMYAQTGDTTHYLRCSVSGATYQVLAMTAIDLAPDQLADLFAPGVLLSDGVSLPLVLGNLLAAQTRLFDPSYTLVDRALRATRAENLMTRWYGKKGAYFGNSIMYMAWPFLEQAFNITMTKLAENGADAQSNLTDANLAAVPADVDLVVIAYGSGNNVPDAGYRAATDVTSRDRSTSEGAINYAVDWLTTNRPNAQIIFITPIYCGTTGRDNTKWNTAIRNLASYRQIPLCDVWNGTDISARNWSVLSDDNIHLNSKGLPRHVGVIAGFLRSTSI